VVEVTRGNGEKKEGGKEELRGSGALIKFNGPGDYIYIYIYSR